MQKLPKQEKDKWVLVKEGGREEKCLRLPRRPNRNIKPRLTRPLLQNKINCSGAHYEDDGELNARKD